MDLDLGGGPGGLGRLLGRALGGLQLLAQGEDGRFQRARLGLELCETWLSARSIGAFDLSLA